MKVDLYNLKNEKVGDVEISDRIFNAPWKPVAVKQVLDALVANARRPWAHAKDRSEVRGGGRKPWRQKGTGRARHGSIRSPLWSGGGKAHGPVKMRDYTQKINKKMKQAALFSVLSKKVKDSDLKIIASLAIEAPKTKVLAEQLKFFAKPARKTKKLDILMIPEAENKNIFRAAANLVKTEVLHPGSLNVYDIVNHKHILIDQRAIAAIEKQYKKNER